MSAPVEPQVIPASAVENTDLPASTSTNANPAAPTHETTSAPAAATEGDVPASSITAAEESVKIPFPGPVESATPTPRPELTPDQQTKFKDFLANVSNWTEAPSTSAAGAPSAPLTDDERMFLTHERILQYLRAVKWSPVEAPKRLLATLVWRREYGVAKLTGDYISPENETGKQVLLGYDNAARPCLYLIPSKQNTKTSDRQVEHLVFMVERVIDLMVPGQETLSLLVNFNQSRSRTVPSFGQGKQVLNILQTHYPERLGRALVINLPWFINGFFKLITPLIDPMTREKLRFNEDVRTHVPPSQLWTGMGGDVNFEYDHAIYWPAMLKLAEERRQAYVDRWIKGGKRIGERDGYLRGGQEKSLSEIETDQASDSSTALPDPIIEKADADVPDVSTLKVAA
ncbi:MAG: hypothetical protein M1825_001982 [Sarcosagium campestre]|nr:MAG: hypothetical protein M1825_001982 [Sarcosagium campestre]